MIKRYFQIAIATTLIATITSCGKKAEQTETPNPITVNVENVKSQNVANQLEFAGRVEATTSSRLSTRVMGQIESIKVDIGDNVKKGQLLLTIKSADLIAQLSQIESNSQEVQSALDNALKNQQRMQNLFKSESASQKEVDDINTHVKMLMAKRSAINEMKKQVKEQLKYAKIRAPFSGTISARFANIGDMANPGIPLIGIETTEKFEVVSSIPEYQFTKIAIGDTVKLSKKEIDLGDAIITQINQSGAYSGAQYQIKAQPIDISNLYSGMFVRLAFESEKTEKILIPQKAIVHKGQLTAIWIVNSSQKAMLRYIRTGKQFGDKIEILSGLSEGENYILPGNYRLKNNIHVKW